MFRYIAKRLIHLIPVLLVITVVLFALLKLMPGDVVSAYLGTNSNVTPEQRENIEEKLGLNDNIVVQYGKWLGRTLTGDFGMSFKFRQPVTEVIGSYIWNTFLINIIALILALFIAIPVGIRSAVKKYGAFDNTWTVFSLVGFSMPSFFFALCLIFFVAVPFTPFIPLNGMHDAIKLAIGYDSVWDKVGDVARHLILPVTVMTVISLAGFIKYVRNSMLDVIRQDYIRTARAKGLKEKVVIYRHAFRNALIPLVTLLGFQIPALFMGAIILETVFLWPGIGNILYTSVMDRDIWVVMAANTFYAALALLGNLLADVCYALVDPRVKTS